MSRTINSTFSSGISLTDTADNPVNLTSNATITDTSGIAALYAAGGSGKSWTISNYGVISQQTKGSGIQLGAAGFGVANSTIINQGTISGGVGIRVFNTTDSTVTNLAGGTITGNDSHGIELFGSGTVTNAGVISASTYDGVYLRQGGVVINEIGATISGGNGVVLGSAGTGTFINRGTVIGLATGGLAVLMNYGGGGRLVVDPGAVFDGNVNGGSGSLELTSGASTGTLASFDGNSIANFSSLQFDTGAQWTVAGSYRDSGLGGVKIDGFAAGDTIDLTDFIATHAALSSEGLVLTNSSNQHATLHILGSFAIGEFQIGHLPGQSIITLGTSTPFGLIAGSYATGVTLTTPGVSVTGTISVTDGTALYGDGGAYNTWTIVNSGTISSGKGDAVALGSGTSNVGYGSLTNEGGGVISGATVGVYIYGPGAVTNLNTGTITGTAANGIRITGTVGAVANYGLLVGGQDGVYEAAGGAVTNAADGTITGSEHTGIVITGGHGTVVNSGVVYGKVGGVYERDGVLINQAGGTISGDVGVSFQLTGTVVNAGVVIGKNTGVSLYGGSTLTNAGTITAGDPSKYAVLFHDGDRGASRLIVQPGAVFNGKIAGYGGVIELAPTTSVSTLAGFGTDIIDFSVLQFDPGGQWLVSGSSSDAGFGTIAIVGFVAGDTIDLTDFAAVSETFSSDALLLTDGKGAQVTLHIQGALTSANFHLGPDGKGGSLITEVLGPTTFQWTGDGDWNNGTNWDLSSVPGAIDTAVIDKNIATTATIASGKSVAIGDVSIAAVANTLQIDGTLAASGTVTITAGMLKLSNTGVVSGGTIADLTGTAFVFTGGIFSGVTAEGPLNIATNAGRLIIQNGLTATGPGGVGVGTINLTEGGDAIIDFQGSQTIDNVNINLNGTNSFNSLTEITVGGNGSTLTLGSHVTISSTAAKTRADIDDNAFDQTMVVNQGTIIAAASSGNFGIAPVNGFANQGTMLVSNGDYMQISPGFGIFNNTGIVTVTGGSTLKISSSAVTPPMSNTGTIVMGAGTTLDLAGFYTVPALGTLLNEGATTLMEGIFDDESGTLTLGPGTLLNNVLLSNQIRNATIIPNGALTIIPGNASLQNVIHQGPLGVTADFTLLTISQGVQVTDITGSLPGTISVTGQADTLAFANDGFLVPSSAGQMLDNITVNIGNKSSADIMQANFLGGTFTIGPNASIVSTAIGAQATLAAGPGTVLNLEGVLGATGKEGSFTVAGVASAIPGNSSTVHNDGTIIIGNGDTLKLTTAITDDTNTGTIELGSDGTFDVGGSFGAVAEVAANQTLLFADGTGTLLLRQPASFAASISGFKAGDVIDLPGIVATDAAWTSGTPGQLAISNKGTPVVTLSLLGDYSATPFAVDSDQAGGSLITATCYAAGTRILTPRGEVAIERLREGEPVVTVSGQTQLIRWIGHRRVKFHAHPNRMRIQPVRIAAHAFGPDRPRRELILSPDHAVFVDDALVPVMHLINGRTIASIDVAAITYYHIELPQHDIVLAEGLPAESYLEAGAGDAFVETRDMARCHDEFAALSDRFATLWEVRGYAPLVLTGDKLEKVRQSLGCRARVLELVA